MTKQNSGCMKCINFNFVKAYIEGGKWFSNSWDCKIYKKVRDWKDGIVMKKLNPEIENKHLHCKYFGEEK